MFDLTSTILAVSSPPGVAPRGIVRASGGGARALLAPHLRGRAGSDPWRPRHLSGAVLELDRPPLPVLVMAFAAPRSYTGEDVVEIQLPGNPVLLEGVIDGLVRSGTRRGLDVRRADPGEFTARAFFNGRLSLSEAEGVAATIAARCDASLRAARLLAGGGLARLGAGWADAVAGTLALVEAGIDFSDEEDVVAITPAALRAAVGEVLRSIGRHLERAVGTEQLAALPWVVLLGPPNAGKSTLFNALLGHGRALVSAVAGTTRDVLSEPLTIATGHGPAEVMLVDLAGADEDPSEVARRARAAAAEALARAELVLRCAPAGEPAAARRAGELLVRTKADLAPDPPGDGEDVVRVSALEGRGLDELRSAIARRLAARAVSLAADALALQPHHEAALRSAAAALAEAWELARTRPADRELIAASLRGALDDLGELSGRITPDDVLGRVFASFCIGK